jgi:hypothetical protein
VGPRAGLDGCGKFSPTGIRSPDRPARGESLYRLSDPGPLSTELAKKVIGCVKNDKLESKSCLLQLNTLHTMQDATIDRNQKSTA